MQEYGVPLDPMLEHRLPWFDRLFVIYLLVVAIFVLARFMRFAWHLWIFSPPKQMVTESSGDTTDFVARTAFAGKFSKLQDVEIRPRDAQCRFEYLWAMSVIKVKTMKNLVVLTLILTGLVLAQNLMQLGSMVTTNKFLGPFAIAGSLTEDLQFVVLAMIVAAAIYILACISEATLGRRRASWDRFVTRTENGESSKS